MTVPRAWRCVAARTTGRTHRQTNVACQDAFEHIVLSNGVVAVAVADGAGYAARGGEGAREAVREALTCLTRVRDLPSQTASEWGDALRASFRAAREKLLDLAIEDGANAQEFATTLQVVVLGDAGYCYSRIGDGGAVGKLGDEFIALGPAPTNTFVNETEFITSGGVEPYVTAKSTALHGYAIFTDGIQHLAMKHTDWSPHAAFFGPLFDFAGAVADEALASSELEAFLAGPKFDSRSDDDRTLVLVV